MRSGWKLTTFAGHLILSVTTRRSHRRSGLETKLSREMEENVLLCQICKRSLSTGTTQCNGNEFQQKYIIELYHHNKQRSNDLFIYFGRRYPRIWRVMSTALSKNLGLFKTAAVQIGIVDLCYTAA